MSFDTLARSPSEATEPATSHCTFGSLVHPDAIRASERLRERLAMRAELHRVRARLEHGDESRSADAPAQARRSCLSMAVG